MVGVSFTIAIFFVLEVKSLLLKCFAVLRLGFLPLAKNRHEEILCVFQEAILQRKGKRLGQNRIMSYETPPNTGGHQNMRVDCKFHRIHWDFMEFCHRILQNKILFRHPILGNTAVPWGRPPDSRSRNRYRYIPLCARSP